ncbi:type IV pilus modification PilV family protein [Cloacibacillus evryensis]|mgnify:FL=1|uniref:type IV pilus modification PilV family protein n=1 Tax=Cloacibacillus evryensis TaxID=508460 RepID=UPI0004B4A51B|nr:hypothetical protein [Cloacibacillus evryensis]MCQ4762891.1 hypothetical protein [Cloacibacillus evryensis]
MMRRGSLLAEVLVSILVFTIGLLALGGCILYSMRLIAASKETLQQEQDVINAYDKYMLKRVIDNDGTPEGAQSGGSGTIRFSGNGSEEEISYNLYRYSVTGKKGSEIYVIQRDN